MRGQIPTRALLFSSAALALGGATLFLSYDLFQSRAGDTRVASQVRQPAVIKILVAARDLTPGMSVKPDDLAWRDWPANTLNPAYINATSGRSDNYAGHIVRTEIVAGEPITDQRLVAPGSRSALAAVTEPGSRAVSISLNATSGVSGLIIPGDRVDVVLSYVIPCLAGTAGNCSERRAAATILSNLRVLAVDQKLSGAPNDSKEIHNASLEVTPRQSEVLALAADLGKLSLSLRGLDQTANDVVATGTSTVDYQVGHLLPGLSAAAAGRNGGHKRQRAPSPSLVEFHGGTAAGAGPGH